MLCACAKALANALGALGNISANAALGGSLSAGLGANAALNASANLALSASANASLAANLQAALSVGAKTVKVPAPESVAARSAAVGFCNWSSRARAVAAVCLSKRS